MASGSKSNPKTKTISRTLNRDHSNSVHNWLTIQTPTEAAKEAFHRPLYHLRKDGERNVD